MLVKMMVRGILTPCVSRGSMIALSLAPVLLSGCPSPNHAPELVPPPDTTVMVGQSLSVPIQADDPDDDAITISLLQGPDSATLVNRTLLWSPAAADVGTHAFVLAAVDHGSPVLTSYTSFSVSVVDPAAAGENHPPLIEPVPDVTLVGQSLALSLAVSDPDGDGVSLEIAEGPAGLLLQGSQLLWTPSAADAGTHHVIVAATDDGTPPLGTFVGFSVTVVDPDAGPNHPPAFWSVAGPGTAEPCSAFSASFEAIDPDGDPIQYYSLNLPLGASLTTSGSLAQLDWMPDASQLGTHLITIYAQDNGTPAMTDVFLYLVEVVAPDFPSVASVTVNGGDVADLVVPWTSNACYTIDVSNAPTAATWDEITSTLSWATEPLDFGVYDVTFTRKAASAPGSFESRIGRIVVRYEDEFQSFSDYGVRDADLPPCCPGPVNRSVQMDANASDGFVLHTSSALNTDVHGHAYRVFDRTAVPLSGIAYELSVRDVVVGPACGSGGALRILDFPVVDPVATWPNFNTEPNAAFAEGVPDGAMYAQVSGSGEFSAPVSAMTLDLAHFDNSNICTVDVYWDHILLTPLAPASPTP